MRFFLFLISPLPLMPAKTAIRSLAAVLPIKLFTSYKVTLTNIQLSFSYLNETETLKLAKESYPKSLLDEVEEDLNEFADTLKKLGAEVHRPKPFDLSKIYSSPFYS